MAESDTGNGKAVKGNVFNITGYGKGKNKGTEIIRMELLWRDYIRFYNRKFGKRLFLGGGFRGKKKTKWKGIVSPLRIRTERAVIGLVFSSLSSPPTGLASLHRYPLLRRYSPPQNNTSASRGLPPMP